MPRNYWELLNARISQGTNLCVGLDPVMERMPERVRKGHAGRASALFDFNWVIVQETASVVCAYKLSLAFYLAYGQAGLNALEKTISYIRQLAPDTAVILDGKFGDIGNTNEYYARFAFDVVGADAITVHPYLGSQAMQPFLDRADKGIYVLCRTSNPGADEFQDRMVRLSKAGRMGDVLPLYQAVAFSVSEFWNVNRNCGLVTGATYPAEIKEVRGLAPTVPLLIPGIGKQGGDLEAAIHAAMGQDGNGPFIINVSSAICHASSGDDFAEATAAKAKFYRDEIRRFREAKEVMP